MNERQLQDSDLGGRHMDLAILIMILWQIFSGLMGPQKGEKNPTSLKQDQTAQVSLASACLKSLFL